MTQQLLHAPLVWGVAEVGLVGGNSSQQRQAVFYLLFQGLDYVAFRHKRDVLRKFARMFGGGWFGSCCLTHVETPLKNGFEELRTRLIFGTGFGPASCIFLRELSMALSNC